MESRLRLAWRKTKVREQVFMCSASSFDITQRVTGVIQRRPRVSDSVRVLRQSLPLHKWKENGKEEPRGTRPVRRSALLSETKMRSPERRCYLESTKLKGKGRPHKGGRWPQSNTRGLGPPHFSATE